MADIRAFRGIRYRASQVGDLADVVCAPYDVITTTAQSDCYARNDHNAVRLELGKDEPGDDARQNRYTRAAAYLGEWLKTGALEREVAPSLYVYEESFVASGVARRRRGFFAAVRLEEWDRRVVLPHERTMPKPRADRLSLLRACRANLSPVFGLYEDPDGRIAAALDLATRSEPVVEFTLGPEAVAAAASGHRLWRLDDPAAVAAVQGALADRAIFIADGHHRYETALENWREVRAAGAPEDDPASRVLMVLSDLSDPGLVVLPTHRLVRAPGLDRAALLRELGKTFAVSELPVDLREPSSADRLAAELARLGESSHAFALVGPDGVSHLISAPPSPKLAASLPSDRSDAWRALDVAVLHELVLKRALRLGGEELGDGARLAYTRDAAEALASVASGEHDLAILLNPTRVSQIRDVALAADRMPEKSTYFWPKPPTGLVFYPHW